MRAAAIVGLACTGGGCGDDIPTQTAETSDTAGSTGPSATTSNPPATTVVADDTAAGPDMGSPPVVECTVDPIAESGAWPGPQADGSTLLVNGRRTHSYGDQILVTGHGFDVVLHPTLDVAYVTTAGRNERYLYVLDRNTHAVLQEIERGEAYYGMALSPDGGRLYASNGVPGGVAVFDIAADGMVTATDEITIADWTAGMALSPDGSTLWVATFDAARVTEVDTATLTVTRTIPLGLEPFDVLFLPGRNELWASALGGEGVAVYDLTADALATTIALPAPSMMVAAEDESAVYVSVTGADQIARVNTDTRAVEAAVDVAEPDFVDGRGVPLPNSNVSALLLDAASDRLYAARGSDAAVGVFEASTLTALGSIPTGWYPAGLAVSADGEQLVVTSMRANGTRSHVMGEDDDDGQYRGGVSFIDLPDVDLADATNDVVANFRRPLELAVEPDCGPDFPLPVDYGGSPVIEHVVLIVNENQTFDALFGESAETLGVEADPAFLKWEAAVLPNKLALAQRYVVADHFFTDSEESDSGHVFLTATHWNEYVERIKDDRDEYGVLGFYVLAAESIPSPGNFFSWLVDHGKTIRIYGEIVGTAAESTKGPVLQFSDVAYPGGTFVNYAVEDEVKAQYVAERVGAGELANFTFISLPNDHGVGVTPGQPTPPSMTADTDYGVGIIVDAISHSPFWESTVIIVLQDDPQGSDDHIDRNRSPLQVIGPWARRGYASHAHYSFSSVFATIERLLGVPPIGRPDASAAPMWDMFTNVPDLSPYDALERQYPKELANQGDPGVAASQCMDFRGPDRNPGLGVVVEHYLAFRRGEVDAATAQARMTAALAEPEARREAREEREEELSAHAAAVTDYQRIRAGHPELDLPPLTEPPAWLGPAPRCDAR